MSKNKKEKNQFVKTVDPIRQELEEVETVTVNGNGERIEDLANDMGCEKPIEVDYEFHCEMMEEKDREIAAKDEVIQQKDEEIKSYEKRLKKISDELEHDKELFRTKQKEFDDVFEKIHIQCSNLRDEKRKLEHIVMILKSSCNINNRIEQLLNFIKVCKGLRCAKKDIIKAYEELEQRMFDFEEINSKEVNNADTCCGDKNGAEEKQDAEKPDCGCRCGKDE